MNWTKFTAADFASFGGAEHFNNGLPPMRATLWVDGVECIAILDRTGIQVTWPDGSRWWVAGRVNSLSALALLTEQTTEVELHEFGFELQVQN